MDKYTQRHYLNGLNRRDFIVSGTAATVLAGPALAALPKTKRPPNIIFIMADDLGYADLGCYGAREIRTPAIDKLAKRGLRLTDGYANSPVCSSTRTALMTGQYQYRLDCGLYEPLAGYAIGLPKSQSTLPKELKKLGYTTSLVGKWHLGGMPDHTPQQAGYDTFYGVYDGGADYFTHRMEFGPMKTVGLVEGDTLIERQGYLTDLLGDRTVDQIEESAASGDPFFISLHFTAPHWPWEGPEDEAVAETVSNPMHIDGGNLKTYAKMVESMDANVAKVMKALKRHNLDRDTIVVFTSDNGGERFSDTWPFVGAKTELLEGGIRVPIIIHWPERIRKHTVSSQVMISMDFVPTLIATAEGATAEAAEYDGLNLLPTLLGDAPIVPRSLYWRYKAAEQAALRDGAWKYLKIYDQEYLFNLTEDARERANLKDLHVDRFEAMRQRWAEWNTTMLPYEDKHFSHSVSDYLADRYTPSDAWQKPPGAKP